MLSSASAPLPILIGDHFPDEGSGNRVLIPAMDKMPERPPSDQVLSLDGTSMGTTWQVRLVPPPGASLEGFRAAIEDELARIIALFSPWVDDSEITRFNRAPAGRFDLSPDFFDVLAFSMDMADRTRGAVDPTLGALVDLWGFGPLGPRPSDDPLPATSEIAEALSVSGWQKLALDAQALGAAQIGGMRLDFSGIAKGRAVDRVSERLSRMGATSHLVEIGGELKGCGVKPDGQPWWVEIETVEGLDAPRTLAALYEIAVATSGDWRKTFTHDGVAYSHTLDGATGRPVANGVAQVTVFDAQAMRADALATAFTVMGVPEALSLASSMDVAAHFVVRTEDGLVEHMSPAFAAMLEDEA